MQYRILITKQALKDIKLLSEKERGKLRAILKEILSENPYLGKKLVGQLKGNFSYRLNLKDRIIYSIDEQKKTIYIKRTRTHYSE